MVQKQSKEGNLELRKSDFKKGENFLCKKS